MVFPAPIITFPHPESVAVTEMSPTKPRVQCTWEEQGFPYKEGTGEHPVALQRARMSLQRRQGLP